MKNFKVLLIFFSVFILLSSLWVEISQSEEKARLVKISKSLSRKYLNNLEVLFSTARFAPHVEDGKMQGVKFYFVKPKSPWDKMGFKKGDIWLSTNGKVIEISKDQDIFQKIFNFPSPKSVLKIKRGEEWIDLVLHWK